MHCRGKGSWVRARVRPITGKKVLGKVGARECLCGDRNARRSKSMLGVGGESAQLRPIAIHVRANCNRRITMADKLAVI